MNINNILTVATFVFLEVFTRLFIETAFQRFTHIYRPYLIYCLELVHLYSTSVYGHVVE